MRNFSTGVYNVADVCNRINEAKELKDILWDKSCEHHCSNGSLDYSQTIEITVRDAVDTVHALELLIDQLLSRKLNKPGD